MIYYALLFMLVGLIPSALNLAGASVGWVQGSSIVIVVGVVLAAIYVLKKSITRLPLPETLLTDNSRVIHH